MDDHSAHTPDSEPTGYHPPTVTYLGDLSEMTRQGKEVGAADGTVFQGIDMGSI